MHKVAFWLWLTLVLYTIFYLGFFGGQSSLLNEILSGSADIFASSFFNLMGLVPLYFLIDYLFFFQRTKMGIFPFIFGFLGGAFSILLGYRQTIFAKSKMAYWMKILIGVLIVLTTFIIIQGFYLGKPELYFSVYFADSLVGIMTVDFLILYVWSVYLAKQRFHHWYIAFVPMIGYGLSIMLFDIRDQR